MKFSPLFLALSFLLLTDCSSDAKQQSSSTNTDGKVTIAQFEQILGETSNAQLVDVRTPQEYDNGHLKSAVNINFNSPNFEQQIEQLNKSQPVFIYCQAGGRSGKAYKKMKAIGFDKVYDMAGGYGEWSKNK